MVFKFAELVKNDRSLSLHTRKLPILVVEMYKVLEGTFRSLFAIAFLLKRYSKYDLCCKNIFDVLPFRSEYKNTESIFGFYIWEPIPTQIIDKKFLKYFQSAIKT